jgi:hypothetical protein
MRKVPSPQGIFSSVSVLNSWGWMRSPSRGTSVAAFLVEGHRRPRPGADRAPARHRSRTIRAFFAIGRFFGVLVRGGGRRGRPRRRAIVRRCGARSALCRLAGCSTRASRCRTRALAEADTRGVARYRCERPRRTRAPRGPPDGERDHGWGWRDALCSLSRARVSARGARGRASRRGAGAARPPVTKVKMDRVALHSRGLLGAGLPM